MKKHIYLIENLKLLLIIFFTSALTLNLNAQIGPGGVGNSGGFGGQPTNILWLVADSLGLGDGAAVAGWRDISGNAHDMTSGAADPIYKSGIVNSKGVVRFTNASSQYLDFYPNFNTTDGVVGPTYTFFWVAARRTTNTGQYVFGGDDNTANQNLYTGWGSADELLVNHGGTNDCSVSTGSYYTHDANEFGFVSAVFNSAATGTTRELFDNGTSVATSTNTNALGTLNNPRLAYGPGPSYADVDMAEVIFYNTNLNTAQKRIVENYLSQKYNIAFQAAGNDKYGNGANYNSSYVYGIAGIGKESDGNHTQTNSGGLYLYERNSTLDNGEYVMLGHNNTANSASTATAADVTAPTQKRWARDWYLEETSSDGIDVKLIFDFKEALTDGKYPTNVSNYVLLYRAGTTGAYSKVTVAGQGIVDADQVYFDVDNTHLANGYYTIGTIDQTNSPVEGANVRTWYALIDVGDWDTWEHWTLDPSGQLPNNPGMETPGPLDHVVIQTGKTMEVKTNGKSTVSITVEGILQLGTTTGHGFTKIMGNGRIRLSGYNLEDNFPAGDATDFITAGQGEGTVVFKGTSYSITHIHEFYNVEIDLDNSTDVLTLKKDLTINGNLIINNGIFKINDNSSTTALNIDLKGGLLIESAGKIHTGSANARHQFNFYGDVTNNGELKFTNRTLPLSTTYYNNEATNGIVDANFLNPSKNQTIQCNGISNFYRIEINKGSDDTYELYIVASSTDNFKLFGYAREAHASTAQLTDNANALGLIKGTVRIGPNVEIPVLNNNVNYNISEAAQLWVDGGTVIKPSGTAIVPYGVARVSAGTFTSSVGSGFTTRDNGMVKVEGGTLNANQIRTSVLGSGNVGGYYQSGGTANINGVSSSTDYYTFNLTYGDNAFTMTGGTLHVNPNSKGGIFIASNEGNYNVTGGTVIMDINNSNDFVITSTAPFYDVILRKSLTTSTKKFILGAGTNVGSTNENLAAQPLVAYNDLTIEDGASLDGNGQNLEIVGDFNMNDGGNYVHGGGTLKFFGDHNGSQINIGDNTSEPGLTIYNLEIDKDQNYNVSVLDDVDLISSGRANNSYALRIENGMLITRGEFDVKKLNVRLEGDLKIVDGNILYDATTPGYIVLNGTAAQTIKGSYTKEQDFGNLELNNSSGATLLSNINVKNVTLTDGIMNLDVYNLDVSGDLSGSFGTNEMFETAGNIGDGGITRYWDLTDITNTILFPIGSGTIYTPATITKSGSISDAGKFTVNPVNSYHPALKPGNTDKTIPYYWVVDTAGFSSVTYGQIQYIFDYPGTIPNNAKKGVVLWDGDWLWYDMGNCLSGSTITFPYGAYLTTEFAMGNPSIFKTPEVYYSTTAGRGNDTDFGNLDKWTNPACWSTVGHYSTTNAGTYPQAGDIAIMGFGLSGPTATADDGQRSHWFFVDADVDVGKIIFADEVVNANGVSVPRTTSYQPQLIINNDANLDFIAGAISGNGTFNVEVGCTSCNADPSVSVPVVANIDADFSDFANNLSSRFDYDLYINNNTVVYLPTSFPEIYPNVHVKGRSGSNRALIFQEDILIQSSLTIRENAVLRLSNTVNGDIEVLGDLNFTINAGNDQLQFPTSGNERTFTLHGDIIMEDGDADQITVLNTTPSGLEHRFRLGGSIDKQSGNTIDFFTNNTGGNNVILEFFGDASSTFTSDNNPPDLYRIEMNKVTGNQMHIQTDINLGGPTDVAPKAIELISGDLFLDNSDIDINLNTGGADFKIPSGTSFQIKYGIVRVSGNNTGIWLDDKLTIGYSGQVLCNGGTNNYIEYTNSGNSEIYIEQGTLKVGSQIRRPINVSTGILHFTQNKQNSTAVIGTDGTAPVNNRGIFELGGSSSTFKQSEANSEITIACKQANPSVPALYFKDLSDANVSIATGSKFIIGGAAMSDDQNIGIYSDVNLKNIAVESSNGYESKATMWTVPLNLDENLEINSGAEFDANGLTLNIAGDMTNDGTFSANQNTTYFNGTSAQNILGTEATTFYNLTKSTTTSLSLVNDITVDNVFDMATGTLNDGGKTITVKGNVNFGGTHNWGGSGNGIYLNGNSLQQLTGSGTFGKLTINNPSGISIPVGNEITINDYLQLQSGVLKIGGNYLTLNKDCKILESNPFGVYNMIQTNVSFTDNGVKKIFPAGAQSFTYPIGSGGKYTPVKITTTQNTVSGAYITAKGADEYHPTIINDSEGTDPAITDTLNVLQYYWVLRANGFSDFRGTINMYYDPADVKVTSPYDVYDYVTAKLLNDGTGNWLKFDDVDLFDETGKKLIYNLTSEDADALDISGDYTAGVDGSSFKGAIPDQVPLYQSNGTGGIMDWNTASTWTVYNDGTGAWVSPASMGMSDIPRGARVRILAGDIVETTLNYISAYTTEINGTLDVGTTFGNRVGEVTGTGTLYSERGSLPAGYYSSFFSSSGGTVEFGGSTSYSVLSNNTQVNNLTFSGIGNRELPNLTLTVLGDLLFSDSGTSSPDVVNEFDKNMLVGGNITFNAGTYDAGNVDSKITMNGTSAQTIGGNLGFTGTNAFYNFGVNNSNGVILTTPVDVDKNLTLTSGIVTTDATNILSVTTTGATVTSSATSYVDGPMRKKVGTNGSFVFPVGDAGRYGPVAIYNTTNASSAYWIAEYFNTGHSSSAVTAPLVAVSTNEYWEITNPTSGDSAKVELRWDANSDITPISTGDINDIVVAEYDGSNWIEKASNVPVGNNYSGTVKTTSAINTDPIYYTLGSKSVILAKAYFTTLDDICEGSNIPVSFSGVDNTNKDFSLDYNYDDGSGAVSKTVTFSSLPYSLPTTDGPGTYTLTAFDYNNPPHTPPVVNGVVDGSTVTVNETPTVTIADPSAICEGSSTTINAVAAGGTGVYTYLWDNSATVSDPTISNPDVFPTTTTTYNVVVTDENFCQATDPDGGGLVTVNAAPTPVPTAGAATVCYGESIDLNPNVSASAYNWTPASAELVVDGGTGVATYTPSSNPVILSQNITFTLVVDYANGCTSDGGDATFTLYRTPETGPQYHISNDWGN